jgi:hypothetical protein
MKRIIIFLCLLAVTAAGQGLGDWPVTNNTGAGLSTLDSLYVIGLSRFGGVATFGTGVGFKLGTAATSPTVKDTLGVRVRAVSAMFDTVTIAGTNCQIAPRDAGTANMLGGAWFFNGAVQAYGGIDGVAGAGSITAMNNGTFAGLVTAARFKSTGAAGTRDSLHAVVTDSVMVGVLASKSGAAITVNTTDTLKATLAKVGTLVTQTTFSIGGIATSPSGWTGDFLQTSTNGALLIKHNYTGNYIGTHMQIPRVAIACTIASPTTVDTTTSGWMFNINSMVGKRAGNKVVTDTIKANILTCAKDTSLEVALFTRTCTRDTLTFMTGADSLVAAYIVSPFYTRGAPTARNPYIAGVVGGKLIVDRPAADTATFDRYAVTKIKQRNQ